MILFALPEVYMCSVQHRGQRSDSRRVAGNRGAVIGLLYHMLDAELILRGFGLRAPSRSTGVACTGAVQS